ncbi:hypothetical protein L1887_48051 [Cichorium endivia]|nr:hypothetical protein L1887_48051 [Cichorium endivia]
MWAYGECCGHDARSEARRLRGEGLRLRRSLKCKVRRLRPELAGRTRVARAGARRRLSTPKPTSTRRSAHAAESLRAWLTWVQAGMARAAAAAANLQVHACVTWLPSGTANSPWKIRPALLLSAPRPAKDGQWRHVISRESRAPAQEHAVALSSAQARMEGVG